MGYKLWKPHWIDLSDTKISNNINISQKDKKKQIIIYDSHYGSL